MGLMSLAKGSQHRAVDEWVATRQAVERHGAGHLTVDDLAIADLPRIAWSGSARHVQAVAEVLARVASGETEYLAVRAVDRLPVAIGGVDYAEAPGVGTIFQLSTHSELQGLGLGTALIAAAEDRIRRRGVKVARVGVEDDNPRARRLYQRLGYREIGQRPASWEAQAPDGSVFLYEALVTELDKDVG
jgi:ribosomal protein S18 acetylase RimI-like enzyme